jgi:ZIP family zinc transporter
MKVGWPLFALWLQAGLWGLGAGFGLLLGAVIAYFAEFSHRLVAAVMGFGGGVLIAVLAFELMEEAYSRGGLESTIIGFLTGAVLFCSVNWYLTQRGAKHRKRCGQCVQQPSETKQPGSGSAIAVGALLDGIPEAIIIGLSLTVGGAVGGTVLIGFFLANVPQGLSSVTGMKKAGRSATYIFGLWISIAILSGVAAVLGYTIFGGFSPKVVAATTALAAGAVLAMLAETVIPEAFENAQNFIGLITVAGFLAMFILTKMNV